MAKISVKKPFVLNLPSGHIAFSAGGVIDVEDEVAAHWYVQAHSEPVVEQEPAPDKGDEIAAFMAAFEGYEPDAPGEAIKKTWRKKRDQ